MVVMVNEVLKSLVVGVGCVVCRVMKEVKYNFPTKGFRNEI